jgi:prepilin-type N-terminal cleavage/methylation domain-containing protein
MDRLRTTRGRVSRRPVRSRGGKPAAGFTLIELMIAATVLVVGVLAMSGLVGLAVASNGHSRLDTTAVMLTQAVTEQVYAGLKYTPNGGDGIADLVDETDCAAHTTTTWQVESGPGGAPLDANGNIDFSQPKPASGYHMDYVLCSGTNPTVYDVRWNVSQLTPGPNATQSTTHTSILTVGTRMEGGGTGPLTFPINMRVMVDNNPVKGS